MTKKLTPALVMSGKQSGKYFDDQRNGLYLNIRKDGGKQWAQRLTIDGKRKEIGLGTPPAISLAKARQIAQDNRDKLAQGINPLIEREHKKAIPTFEKLARKRHEEQIPTFKEGKHVNQWIRTLELHVFPIIGDRSIDKITPSEIKAVLMPIWLDIPDTARRVKQRMSDIMAYAIALNYREYDPVAALSAALPKQQQKTEHFLSIGYEDVFNALETVKASNAYEMTKLAFEFLVLTAARSGEVRGARWEEIDRSTNTWIIPAERMKAKREHRIPLSDRAINVLDKAASLKQNDLIFPSIRGKVLSDSTISKLIRELGIKAVPHGFRTTFRVWVQEQTNAPDRVAELCLAHVDRNQVRAAYARSDLLEKRIPLMQAWSDYISGLESKALTLIKAELSEDD